MQYHFHLIRNILKLPYCFPLETPSAPKSDNQAGGWQGPSVLGQAHATDRKGMKRDSPPSCHHPLLITHGSQQDSSARLGLGRGPQAHAKGGAPACRAGWV